MGVRAAEDGTSTAVCFARLEKLNLEDNALASWGDVQPLGQLPALACLMLSNNRLPCVAAPAAGTFGANPYQHQRNPYTISSDSPQIPASCLSST